ncbi:MAG: acyl carrier protein [Eubacterium sp.]|jgi:acyl carrier protein|nr:acyl carrier protein [Eubacterium sp.]MCI9125736.1 acyl carrier protein [Eubacterium sp.]MCI9617138.1 acyl carrier protein [Eubacterium sp.]
MRDEVIEILEMIVPDIDVEDEDMNLPEDLDSMDIIALIAELEDKFDIEITMEEKTEENFENIDTLVEMIERLQ